MSKTDIATKALNYVTVSSALTKRALDEVDVHRKAAEKAAAARPEVLGALVAAGCVAEHQKEAADSILAAHDTTLGMLKAAAEKILELQSQVTKQATDLGKGVDDPAAAQSAEYDSLNDPFVGRHTSQKKASDAAMLKLLN